ncbi:DNA methyltransferase [Enterococcus sp. AZ046]|uniref:DNA methyltransferase n=1 Tax=Enterococcus sp. AZ046 TaxID=2774685 RepID=UPI003D28A1E8
MHSNITNPKYKSKDTSHIYKYYAGFSKEFVEDVLSNYDMNEVTLLDPWNGSGTTTRVASTMGIKSIFGFDINPAMVVVSMAEMLNISDFKEVEFKTIRSLKNSDIKNDPLESWFTKTSVRNIRNVEIEFRNALLDKNDNWDGHLLTGEDNQLFHLMENSLLAFYYIVLFETVKRILGKFKSSNPTWIKIAKTNEDKVKISQRDFEKNFKMELQYKLSALKMRKETKDGDINLEIADSRNLPILNDSVDVVITSPPYCTRIDYTVSTRIELALLGVNQFEEFEDLRKKMIGTTKVIKNIYTKDFLLHSKTARKFLDDVYNHNSKASKTYYFHQYLQYFDAIEQSISELDRVSKKGATIYIVVQDSFYKEVYLDLSNVFIEMFHKYKWKVTNKRDFEKKQAMVSVNKKTKKYRNITNPKETVLIFERGI